MAASASPTFFFFKTMLSPPRLLLHPQNPNSTHLINYLRLTKHPKILLRQIKSKKGDNGCFITLNSSSSSRHQTPFDISAGDRLRRLVSEFGSLPEPIDRVKRLLDYAEVLPEIGESGRVEANRVTGCTTQVWVEVGMDGSGRMRFRAGSDSEISKGFCSCLIWVLDGAAPEEVLAVTAEDLGAINVVGLVANSRVNTWRNVLDCMQKRTKLLLLPNSNTSGRTKIDYLDNATHGIIISLISECEVK